MNNRTFLSMFVVALVVYAGHASAQDSLRADYERCVEELTACCGPAKPDLEREFASMAVYFRKELPQLLQLRAAELEKRGVKLDDATLKATHEGADPKKQHAALKELSAAAAKLDAGKAKKLDNAQKVSSVASPATATPTVKDSVVRKQPVQQK